MQKVKWSTAAYAMMFATMGQASGAPRKAAVPIYPSAHTTVLPLSEGPHLLGAGATSYWTPRAADLRELEADLPRSIAGYCRQYIGIVRGGRRLIYVNGFSAAVASEYAHEKFDWHKHAVFVDDGGTGFFEADYDLKTHKFSGPYFHGLG
jgi:hypothetical protein